MDIIRLVETKILLVAEEILKVLGGPAGIKTCTTKESDRHGVFQQCATFQRR